MSKEQLRWSITIGAILIVCFVLCCVIYALVRYAAGL